ncbi:acyltransferase family protein [Hirschia baltica]|uniref:Acyltransferase 3 domain-containing protein n=1 Tax=Hirschia baltica (strain ATCC 49814 / DSM 5838 / IFAM 1418) TaxID=582402 RepID=C6XJ63_HIRBI|nr:acyltransferase family protein [Hirschia baltica]ACT59158.1 hypothetical protein Hbal_1469 [Hirschia baltica ATCC 49814]
MSAVSSKNNQKFAVPSLTKETSQSIKIARVLCIFFMIYVHVNPGVAAFASSTEAVRFFDEFRFFLVNSVGRASVALLSIISGFLVVFSLRKAEILKFVSQKFSSLIIPLIFWNACFLFIVFVIDKYLQAGYLEQSLGETFSLLKLGEYLMGITQAPVNISLSFLRDIFVCALFAPILVILYQKFVPAFIGVVAVLYVLGSFTALLITPNILLFYAIGMFLCLRGQIPKIPLYLEVLSWALLAVISLFILGDSLDVARDISERTIDLEKRIELAFLLIRFPAAIAFWGLSIRISKLKISHYILKLEQFIFIIFCSHVLILTICWGAWQKLLGGYYDPAYPVFFLLGPILVAIIVVPVAIVLNKLLPPVFALINGGRTLPPTRQSRF